METIIVFRACTPIAVAIVEYLFMDRERPNNKSCAALLVIAMGAYAYTKMDAEMKMSGMQAYIWIALWYSLLVFQMTYGKVLLKEVKLDTVWGPVLYTNALSIPPTIVLAYVLGDFEKYEVVEPSENATFWVAMSCIFGIAIGYSGWKCRGMISATSYTLVGVINKLLSVGVSVAFINKSATWQSIAALLVCLAAGTQYTEPPKRNADSIPK